MLSANLRRSGAAHFDRIRDGFESVAIEVLLLEAVEVRVPLI